MNPWIIHNMLVNAGWNTVHVDDDSVPPWSVVVTLESNTARVDHLRVTHDTLSYLIVVGAYTVDGRPLWLADFATPERMCRALAKWWTDGDTGRPPGDGSIPW
jgi:hypothetical protein